MTSRSEREAEAGRSIRGVSKLLSTRQPTWKCGRRPMGNSPGKGFLFLSLTEKEKIAREKKEKEAKIHQIQKLLDRF